MLECETGSHAGFAKDNTFELCLILQGSCSLNAAAGPLRREARKLDISSCHMQERAMPARFAARPCPSKALAREVCVEP